MLRRTILRAVAAGLLTAVFGGPVAAQAPNPWRGESAALPTAPAPRAVTKPTREFRIELNFDATTGLSYRFDLRDLTPPQHVPTTQPLSPRLFIPGLAVIQTGTRFWSGFDAEDRGQAAVPASYATPAAYMPPPAPLPIPRAAP